MLKTLIATTMLLTISCNSIKHIPVKQLSFKFNRCRVYCFNPNTLKTAADEKCGEDFISGDYDILVCDELLGVDTATYAEYLRGKIKEQIRYCEDRGFGF